MTEKIRLVVCDLDKTFWHATLTEGGIRIRPDTCALVKELAARGNMSSIYSKNNLADVLAVLEREGVWDYFVFPSVSWEPKARRSVGQHLRRNRLRNRPRFNGSWLVRE